LGFCLLALAALRFFSLNVLYIVVMVVLFSGLRGLKVTRFNYVNHLMSLAYIDAHVGEVGIGSNHNDGFQSKSMSELDAERELIKKEVL